MTKRKPKGVMPAPRPVRRKAVRPPFEVPLGGSPIARLAASYVGGTVVDRPAEVDGYVLHGGSI